MVHKHKMRGQILAFLHLPRRPRSPKIRDSNRARVVWIVTLLLLSIELPELPTYMTYLYPGIKTNSSDWFICPGFHFNMCQFWYWKFTCERLAWMFRMIAFTKTAAQYSTAVFLASFIILCYLGIDLFLFWWNYNTSAYLYEFLILFIYIIGRALVRPFKPERFAKIKSLF